MQSETGPPVVSFRDWFTTVGSSCAKPGRVSAAQPSPAWPPLPLPAHEPCLQLHSSLPVVSYHGDDECHLFARDRLCCFYRQHNAVLEGGCMWVDAFPVAPVHSHYHYSAIVLLAVFTESSMFICACLLFLKKTQMIRTFYQ